MTPFFEDDWLTVYGGDCRAVLRELPAESVHCVVTSPPYWGLRDYGTATWEGGDPGCDHAIHVSGGPKQTPGVGVNGHAAKADRPGRTCGKCGAHRIDSQLGLETTPEEYVAALVDVFREVRRVLRADGTVWLNLGDSYGHGTDAKREPSRTSVKVSAAQHDAQGGRHGGMAKQLVGIPWRVAFALQADGWYLRSDIIWSKPTVDRRSMATR